MELKPQPSLAIVKIRQGAVEIVGRVICIVSRLPLLYIYCTEFCTDQKQDNSRRCFFEAILFVQYVCVILLELVNIDS